MDARLLIVFGASLLFVGFFAAGYAFLSRIPNLGRRLGMDEPAEIRGSQFDWLKYLRGSEKVLKPLASIIPRSPEEMSRQERRLVAAGMRRRDAVFILHGTKVALAVALLIGVIVTGYYKENPLLFTVLPIFLGAFLPDFWLSRRITQRKERIQEALPDTMDLAVVCVEAGLGLDQSLLRIGKELETAYPDLSEELNLYGLEVNAGKKRVDAFRNLGKRTDVDDLKALVAVLIQTDRFGTSVAQSLRVFADSMRTKRRQRAEERAAKMNIKMIPPLVFFVFPAIWVVVLGPAMIAIIRHLIPGLGGQ
jgi:tight adherence protein C